MLTSHPVQKQAATKRLLGGAAIRCVVAHCCANSNALLQGRYGSTAGACRACTRYGRSRTHAHLGLGLGHLFVWPMADCARYRGGRVVRVTKFVNRACGLVWEGLHGIELSPRINDHGFQKNVTEASCLAFLDAFCRVPPLYLPINHPLALCQ